MEDRTDLSDLNENVETEQNESQIYKSTESDAVHQSVEEDNNELEDPVDNNLENPNHFETNSYQEKIENETEIDEKSELTTDEIAAESTLETKNENIDVNESNVSVSENYENENEVDEITQSFNKSTKEDPNLIVEEPNESQLTISNEIENTETEIDEKQDEENNQNETDMNVDGTETEMNEKLDEASEQNETDMNVDGTETEMNEKLDEASEQNETDMNVDGTETKMNEKLDEGSEQNETDMNVDGTETEMNEKLDEGSEQNETDINVDGTETEMNEKLDEGSEQNETDMNVDGTETEMNEKLDEGSEQNETDMNVDGTEIEKNEKSDHQINENQALNSEGLVIDENTVGKEISNEEIEEKENQSQIEHDDKSVNASLEGNQEFEITNKDSENFSNKTKITQKLDGVSSFFTVHIQLDDGTVKNQIVTIVKSKGKKPFLGGYRHKLSGIEYHNAAVQTRPKPRPPPSVDLFSRDTQTFQIRHQKVNTNNTTSTQMTKPGLYVSNKTDTLIIPGKYETADEYQERILKNIITIQKYYRRWLAKHIVDEKRRQRDERLQWEQNETELKMKEKEERIKKEYERRMHPKTRADFDLLYNGLEKWRQMELAKIDSSDKSVAEKKAEKLALLEEETDLLAAIDRHKIDRKQQSKSEEVQKLLGKAAAPKSWKDNKGRKIQMDTPYTIRSRELLDILNSLNMQYLTQDERLDVLLTLKHTVKEHDCKLTRDIIDLVDREADLIMRNTSDNNLAGLRKRIITLFLQYCKTPTFNPEISLLLKVPPDPTVLIGDINYCKYCGKYLRSVEFSLSTKSSKLTICKACARKENQSRKRQDYSHYRRILKDLQMDEQELNDKSKIAFIFKQNDIKTLMEGVWDNKSILSECEDLDELVFVRWNFREHWSPWNTILMTKDEAEAHRKVINISEIYSDVMITRINQKHVIARNMFESLEKMIERE